MVPENLLKSWWIGSRSPGSLEALRLQTRVLHWVTLKDAAGDASAPSSSVRFLVGDAQLDARGIVFVDPVGRGAVNFVYGPGACTAGLGQYEWVGIWLRPATAPEVARIDAVEAKTAFAHLGQWRVPGGAPTKPEAYRVVAGELLWVDGRGVKHRQPYEHPGAYDTNCFAAGTSTLCFSVRDDQLYRCDRGDAEADEAKRCATLLRVATGEETARLDAM